MPSSKPRRRELPTRTPGVYRDSLTGTYIVRIRVAGRAIKRRGITSYAEACTQRSQLAVKPPAHNGEAPTFAAYFDAWAATYQGRTGRGVEAATLDDYCDSIRRYALPMFGDLRLDKIDAVDLRRFVASLIGRDLARNTVRLAFAPVKLVFAQAVEDGLVDRDPTLSIRIQTNKRKAPRDALTQAQVLRLLAAVPNERDRLFVRLVAETGLRISEAAPLRWRDLDGGTVSVERRVRKGKIGDPKTPAARRRVPLSPSLARDLWAYRNRLGQIHDSMLIWPSRTGLPRTYQTLRRDVLAPAVRRAGIPWTTWHGLRHTCATLLVTDHGFSPAHLQAWLGHEHPEISLGIYTHVTSDALPVVKWDTGECVHQVSTTVPAEATTERKTG
jgi:integrase